MTAGMWIAAAVVGWCGLAVAVAVLVAAVVKLRDLQIPTENTSIDELLEGDDMTRAVGGTGVGGTAPKPKPPVPPKPPAVKQ